MLGTSLGPFHKKDAYNIRESQFSRLDVEGLRMYYHRECQRSAGHHWRKYLGM